MSQPEGIVRDGYMKSKEQMLITAQSCKYQGESDPKSQKQRGKDGVGGQRCDHSDCIPREGGCHVGEWG